MFTKNNNQNDIDCDDFNDNGNKDNSKNNDIDNINSKSN